MRIVFILALCFPVLMWGDFFTAEVRVGDFYPASQKVRRIYEEHNLDVEVEASLKYCQNSALWVNANGTRLNGRSIGLHDKTTLQLFPVSVGYKTYYGLGSSLLAYFGLGASYTHLKLHDKTPEPSFRRHKNAWGTVVKGGVICYLCSQLFLDAFVDYYYTMFKIEGHKNNLGGIRAGIGLGVSF